MGCLDPVSKENEVAVWKLIIETMESNLKKYKFTLDEDNEMLEKDA